MAYNMKTLFNTEERGGTMICTNDGCGKSIEKPLELFDGALACPYCGGILKHKFAVNEENDNLFRLSQAFYFKYLAAVAADNQKKPDLKKMQEIEQDLETAVTYCREAAWKGHPEACVKLGFYWESSYVGKKDSVERFKMAYRYYDEVASLDERTVDVERGEDGVAVAKDYAKNAKFSAVKKEAAARLLRMLAEVGEELQNMMGFQLDEVTERLKAIVGDYGEAAFIAKRTSREEFVLRTLKEAKKNAGDAPVFGYFLMTGNELKNAYGDENSADKICGIVASGGKLDLKWAFLNDLYDNDTENNAFTDLNDNADCLPAESVGENTLVVAFINGAWSPKPSKEIGKKKTKSLNKLSNLLFRYNEPTDALHELCKASKTEFAKIFYADDLYYGCLKNA
jgi:hypothetical protein